MGIPIRRSNDGEPGTSPPQNENDFAQNNITLDLQLSPGPGISSSLRTTAWSPLLVPLNQPPVRRTSTRVHRSPRNFESRNEQRRRFVIDNGDAASPTGGISDQRQLRAQRRNQPNQNRIASWDRIRSALQTAAQNAREAEDGIDCPLNPVSTQPLTVPEIGALRAATSPRALRRRQQPPPPQNATRWQRYQRQMHLIQQGIVLPLSQRWVPPFPDEVPEWWDMSLERLPPAPDESQPTEDSLPNQSEAAPPEERAESPTAEGSTQPEDCEDRVSESESDISDTDSQVLSSLWMIELFSSASDGYTSINYQHSYYADKREHPMRRYIRMKDLRRRLRRLRNRYQGLPRGAPPQVVGNVLPNAPSDIDDEGANRRRRRNGDFDGEDELHRNLRLRDRERSWAERWDNGSTRARDLGELDPFQRGLEQDQDDDAWERAPRRGLGIIHDGWGTPPDNERRAERSNWDDLTVGVGNRVELSEDAVQRNQQHTIQHTASRTTHRARSLSDWGWSSGDGWESRQHPHPPQNAETVSTSRPIRRSDSWADDAWSGWSGGWDSPTPAQWDNSEQYNPPHVRRMQISHAWRAGTSTNTTAAGQAATVGELSVSDDVAAVYTRTEVTTSNDEADEVSGWTDWGAPTTAQRAGGSTRRDDEEVVPFDEFRAENASSREDFARQHINIQRRFVSDGPPDVESSRSPPLAWEIGQPRSAVDRDQPRVLELEDTDDWLAPSTPSIEWEFSQDEDECDADDVGRRGEEGHEEPLTSEVSQQGRGDEENALPAGSLQQEDTDDWIPPTRFDWEGTDEWLYSEDSSDRLHEDAAASDGSANANETLFQITEEYLRYRDPDPARNLLRHQQSRSRSSALRAEAAAAAAAPDPDPDWGDSTYNEW
ncbi:hypothetical protein BJ742DRAFT_898856 [Cladochytrium replicatum]|nr:hypothetical protein BJ742DRAFT_898856 [Cladochytrium replicatum]